MSSTSWFGRQQQAAHEVIEARTAQRMEEYNEAHRVAAERRAVNLSLSALAAGIRDGVRADPDGLRWIADPWDAAEFLFANYPRR